MKSSFLLSLNHQGIKSCHSPTLLVPVLLLENQNLRTVRGLKEKKKSKFEFEFEFRKFNVTMWAEKLQLRHVMWTGIQNAFIILAPVKEKNRHYLTTQFLEFDICHRNQGPEKKDKRRAEKNHHTRLCCACTDFLNAYFLWLRSILDT